MIFNWEKIRKIYSIEDTRIDLSSANTNFYSRKYITNSVPLKSKGTYKFINAAHDSKATEARTII